MNMTNKSLNRSITIQVGIIVMLKKKLTCREVLSLPDTKLLKVYFFPSQTFSKFQNIREKIFEMRLLDHTFLLLLLGLQFSRTSFEVLHPHVTKHS